ncbi:MAG: peptide chain release factor N(5)-glutamine methyltransferase [Bellilinea sp.]|jgi:release factor glutamine methyltransferase
MRKTTIEVGEWLSSARRQIVGSDQPGLEGQLILAHVLEVSREMLLAHPERWIEPKRLEQANALLLRLINGEPLAYLVEQREFYGLTLRIEPGVLVPRPETELLVDLALEWLQRHPDCRRAADVGTGSGCIAAALAVKVDDLVCAAVDRSWKALRVAVENYRRLGVLSRTNAVLGNLLTAFNGPFDLVCANLPYIPSAKLEGLAVSRHEPRLALDGGRDGLALIRALFADASRWLASPGLLLVEIEARQGMIATREASRYIPEGKIDLIRDLNGLARVVRVERNVSR